MVIALPISAPVIGPCRMTSAFASIVDDDEIPDELLP